MNNYSNTTDFNNDSSDSNNNEFDYFGFYIEGLTLTMVSLLGLSGNILSIIVLFKPNFRSAFSNLLRGLAFCDALFLITAVMSFGLPQLADWYAQNVFNRIAPVVFGLLHTFRVGSVYVTMSVTLERFLAVAFPLRSFSKKKYLLPTALTFSLVYNLPKYFEVQTVWNESTRTHNIQPTALRKNHYYVTLYVIWSKLVVTELLPYFTIVVLNAVIVCKAIRASSFRQQFTRKEEEESMPMEEKQRLAPKGSVFKAKNPHQEQNLSRVLLGISALFILCQSFKIIPDLYELFFCQQGQRCSAPHFVTLIVKLSHLLVCVNSSANFLFYFLQGAKFQKAFKETFLGCKCKC